MEVWFNNDRLTIDRKSRVLARSSDGKIRIDHLNAIERIRGIVAGFRFLPEAQSQLLESLVERSVVDLIAATRKVAKAGPLKKRMERLIENPSLAPLPLIDTVFQESRSELEEIRAHAIAIIRAAVARDEMGLRLSLIGYLRLSELSFGDLINGVGQLLDAVAGVKRHPAPLGWQGAWPNLGNLEQFSQWLRGLIAYKQWAVASGINELLQPESAAYAVGNAMAFCVEHDVSIDRLPTTRSGIANDVLLLSAIYRRVNRNPTVRSFADETDNGPKPLDRLQFDDASHSVTLDGSKQFKNIEPIAYLYFQGIANANGSPVSASQILRDLRFEGTRTDRQRKKLPDELQRLIRAERRKGTWISFEIPRFVP